MRHLLNVAIFKAIVWTAGIFLLVHGYHTPTPESGPPPEVHRPLAKGSPEELSQRLDCWSRDEKALAPWPGHVIYRYEGDWKIGGEDKAKEGLDNIFGNKDTGIVVYKFCV